MPPSLRRLIFRTILIFLVTVGAGLSAAGALISAPLASAEPQRSNSADVPTRPPDFARMELEQAATDRSWRNASEGYMRMEKISYRSRAGRLEIPAFVFQPLEAGAPKSRPALVWVHENIRGHLYEHYIPFIRDASSRGYIVIAPEYRGSIGYSKALFDAIDYGGAEVDDVASAVGVLTARYPEVDPARIAIIGWSHGGLITLLSIFRNPTMFRAAAAIVPVTNLFQRIAWKGEGQLKAMDPQNRFGGSPWERHQVYEDRSPLFHVDKLRIPLLVHVAENDEDVNIEESMPLVDALRARKPALAETKVYANPPGGHLFDRLVRESQPQSSEDLRDSWARVWNFFGRHLAAPIEATRPSRERR